MISDDDPAQPVTLVALQPPGWPRPKGFAHGVAGRGRLVLVAGQIGTDTEGRLVDGFLAQTRQTLRNILAVLAEAGGGPQHLARLTWYVVSMDEYTGALAEVGRIYREVIGRHYPTMALVQVVRLVEPAARVEIEATAILPD
jgi:enamine deaminase RidA (YjgF/YER057c/UK114 family)